MSRSASKEKSFVGDSRDQLDFAIDVDQLTFPVTAEAFRVALIFDKAVEGQGNRTAAESDKANFSKEKAVMTGESCVKFSAKLSLRVTLESSNFGASYDDKVALCKVVKVHADKRLESLGIVSVPLSELINNTIAIKSGDSKPSSNMRLDTRMTVPLEDCCPAHAGAQLSYSCVARPVDAAKSTHLKFLKTVPEMAPSAEPIVVSASETSEGPEAESAPVVDAGDVVVVIEDEPEDNNAGNAEQAVLAAETAKVAAREEQALKAAKAAELEAENGRKATVTPTVRPKTLKKTASMFKKTEQVEFVVRVESIDFPSPQSCCRVKIILEKAVDNPKPTLPDSDKADISREKLVKEGAEWVDPEVELSMRSTMKSDATGLIYEDKNAICKVVLIMSDRSARSMGNVYIPLHVFVNAAVQKNVGNSCTEEHFNLNTRLSVPLLDCPAELTGSSLTYHLAASPVDSGKNATLGFLKDLPPVGPPKPRATVAPVVVSSDPAPAGEPVAGVDPAVAAATVDEKDRLATEAERLRVEYEDEQEAIRAAAAAAVTEEEERQRIEAAAVAAQEAAVRIRESAEVMAAGLAEKPREVWNSTTKPLLLAGQIFTRPISGGLGTKTVCLVMQPITSVDLSLEYYEVAPGNPTIPKVGAKVTKIDIASVTKLSTKSGNIICLTHTTKAYEFTAPSQDVQARWVAAIQMANEMLRKRFNHATLLEDVPKSEVDGSNSLSNSRPPSPAPTTASGSSTVVPISSDPAPPVTDGRSAPSYMKHASNKVDPESNATASKTLSGHSVAEFDALKVKYDALVESYRMLSAEKEILKRALQAALAKNNKPNASASASTSSAGTSSATPQQPAATTASMVRVSQTPSPAPGSQSPSSPTPGAGDFSFSSCIDASRPSAVDPSVTEYQINCVWKPRGSMDESEWIKWSIWRRYSQFHKLHVGMKPAVKVMEQKINEMVKNPGNRERSNSMESTLSQASNKLQFPPKYVFVHNLKSIEHRR